MQSEQCTSENRTIGVPTSTKAGYHGKCAFQCNTLVVIPLNCISYLITELEKQLFNLITF